jgi:hypothetical protein
MAQIRTTAVHFYRRGISDRYPRVGANIQGNYDVVSNTDYFKNKITKPNFSFNRIFFSRRPIIPFPYN